jgi:hypothetical protein
MALTCRVEEPSTASKPDSLKVAAAISFEHGERGYSGR